MASSIVLLLPTTNINLNSKTPQTLQFQNLPKTLKYVCRLQNDYNLAYQCGRGLLGKLTDGKAQRERFSSFTSVYVLTHNFGRGQFSRDPQGFST